MIQIAVSVAMPWNIYIEKKEFQILNINTINPFTVSDLYQRNSGK